MIQKLKETIDIQDAMDNIAAIASIDLDSPGPIGIVRRHRIVTSEEELGSEMVQWLSGEGVEPILEVMDLTYRSIHQYLAKVLEGGDRKGIEVMMDLVGESPAKLESYLAMRLGHPLKEKIAEREEFKSLQRFYHEKVEREVEAVPEERGLQDFETVKRDAEYELLYNRNEEGKPYFNPDL